MERIIWSPVLPIVIVIYVAAQLNYKWNRNDARFDCVVGISAGDQPLGTGVFIAMDTIMTSANVVEDYIKTLDKLQVHVVFKLYNESRSYTVGCAAAIMGSDFERKPSVFWLQHGSQEEEENSPLHDLYTLSLNPIEKENHSDLTQKGSTKFFSIASKNKDTYTYAVKADDMKTTYKRLLSERWPFMVRIIWGYPFMYPNDYMWGGFGYLDADHVHNSTWIEMEIYGAEEVQVDCDEWIPREWGRFICIENVGGVSGVPSGAPLIHRGRLVGIGCFMLEKNNESILVFTDLRPYVKYMKMCGNVGRIRNITLIDHGMTNYSEIFWAEGVHVKRLNY